MWNLRGGKAEQVAWESGTELKSDTRCSSHWERAGAGEAEPAAGWWAHWMGSSHTEVQILAYVLNDATGNNSEGIGFLEI